MSDNVRVNAPTVGGGAVVASHEDANSIQHQKVLLEGIDDSDTPRVLASTPEGHLEVAIHAPRLPFGSVHTEGLVPAVQSDAIYGLNAREHISSSASGGTVSAASNLFNVNTGTSAGAFATMQSRKRARYRPGQGVVGRFTALFSAPATNGIQIAGMGTAEAGLYFGYYLTGVFGILHVTGGVREIRTLTVTTKSSSSQNVTVTLNSTDYTVAVTNGADTNQTAYEISRGTYAGWSASSIGSTVVFLAADAGAKSGTYGLSGTGLAGTFAQTLAGANSTNNFIPQTSWNGDPLDGTGPSGFDLDPAYGNVFQINIQYLGFGSISFAVEVTTPDGNNTDFVVCHTLKFPNSRTSVTLSQPAFPFNITAYSGGSTTDISVKSGSYAIFTEGESVFHGNRFTIEGTSTLVDASAYRALVTLRNGLYYGGRANQVVTFLRSVAGAIKHNNPCFLYLIRNAALAGAPNFAALSTTSACYLDTSATTCTFSDRNQVIWSAPLGDTGNIDAVFDDLVSLQPGETVTLAAKSAFGAPSYVSMSLNTQEDR